MSVVNDVLLAVIGMAQIEDLYAPIRIGSLPADNGIAMHIVIGSPDTTFQSKSSVQEIQCAIYAKNFDAEKASNALNDIHQALTQTKTYPQTNDYQIVNIITTESPNYLDREDNGQWLYSSAVSIRFFFKKG